MADIENKVCPLCAETIKAAAKLCPHCRHWQYRFSLQNPQVAVTIWIALCIAGLVCALAFVEKLFGPKQDFAEYQDQITIVSSEFSHRMAGSNLMVTVVGIMTNQSNVSWKDVGLEARFFDNEGRLLDAVVQTGDYHGVSILRHSEEAFRIEGKATRSQASYISHKVTVRWAKDANAWP